MGHKTSLYSLHKAMSGKIVDFGGWDMPINYGSQINEHHAVRRDAGMFDVSHMTVIDVTGPDSKAYLQYLLANDVSKLDAVIGKALYSAMLNTEGGVMDDLIVYNMNGWYRLVVNCNTREKDLAWMKKIGRKYEVEIEERYDFAMIAVQGPNAITKVQDIVGEAKASIIAKLQPFQGAEYDDWFIARTGYTGEDGLEITLPNHEAVPLWKAMTSYGIPACGLGARDTLRLEAGMNLYGHEMDDTTSPLVANMAWTLAFEPESRNFVGRDALMSDHSTTKLVGILLRERGILRQGQEIQSNDSELIGVVTSGSFSPTLGFSIALARVPVNIGSSCYVEIRGKKSFVEIVRPNFVRHGHALF